PRGPGRAGRGDVARGTRPSPQRNGAQQHPPPSPLLVARGTGTAGSGCLSRRRHVPRRRVRRGRWPTAGQGRAGEASRHLPTRLRRHKAGIGRDAVKELRDAHHPVACRVNEHAFKAAPQGHVVVVRYQAPFKGLGSVLLNRPRQPEHCVELPDLPGWVRWAGYRLSGGDEVLGFAEPTVDDAPIPDGSAPPMLVLALGAVPLFFAGFALLVALLPVGLHLGASFGELVLNVAVQGGEHVVGSADEGGVGE